jgi:hypothetical protein
MDVAGRRPRAATVLVRSSPSVCGRSAPWRRLGCPGRHASRRAGDWCRLFRRSSPDGREDHLDPDPARIHGNAPASRLDRGSPRLARRGGSDCRNRRSERCRRSLRSLRLLRPARDERSTGLRRPTAVPACPRRHLRSHCPRYSGGRGCPRCRSSPGGSAERTRARCERSSRAACGGGDRSGG